jgi:hypothetical protein
MAAGLKGEAYVATCAAASVSIHAGRILAYGAGGMITRETALFAAVLTAAILVGNMAGKKIRGSVSEAMSNRIEIGALVGCVTLSMVGAGR